MLKKLSYINLKYSQKDELYIEKLADYIENESKNIINYFNFDKLNVDVILFSDLDEFRKKHGKNTPNWLCGYYKKEDEKHIVNTLCLEEYKKTAGHENNTINDLEKLIIHEFVHACHAQYKLVNIFNSTRWLAEGFAILLSKQDYNNEINVSYEELLNDSVSYSNYYAMVKYIIDEYGKDYLLELLKNDDLANEVGLKIYNEITYSR